MQTNLDKVYKSNSDVEKEGKWIDIAEGVQFKIKRFGGANSSEVKKLNAKYIKPYARQIEKGILPEEVERKLYVRAFVEVSMVDWKGVIADDKEIPYSNDAAIDLFTQLPELFDDIVLVASDFETFREDLGNS